MGTNLYNNDMELVQKWITFVDGHWQKEMPTKPGTYPTANREKERTGNRHVVIPKKGEDFQEKAYDASAVTNAFRTEGTDWGGWWWSEPYPELPEPPEWDATVPSPTDVTGWGIVGQE